MEDPTTMALRRKTLLGTAAVIGVASLTVTAHAATSDVEPSALVFDQAISNNAVAVEYVHLPSNGYVAVYRSDESGLPTGKPIGSTNLDAGDHRKIQVELTDQPKAGEQLWVSLYRDADGKPTFDPGAGDEPLWAKGKQSASTAFIVR